MKQFRGKIVLLGIMAIGLGLGSVDAGEITAASDGGKSGGLGSLVDEVAKETRLAGTLNQGASLLVLDSPIYFAKGSKSERVVTEVRLSVPEKVRDKVMKLENRHVTVVGPMACTMEFSPWTAICELTVGEIETAR